MGLFTTEVDSPDMSRLTVSVPRPSLERSLRHLLEPLAFWASVVLPLSYVPLLYGGFGDGEFELFLALVASHVLCLVIGHGYGTR